MLLLRDNPFAAIKVHTRIQRTKHTYIHTSVYPAAGQATVQPERTEAQKWDAQGTMHPTQPIPSLIQQQADGCLVGTPNCSALCKGARLRRLQLCTTVYCCWWLSKGAARIAAAATEAGCRPQPLPWPQLLSIRAGPVFSAAQLCDKRVSHHPQRTRPKETTLGLIMVHAKPVGYSTRTNVSTAACTKHTRHNSGRASRGHRPSTSRHECQRLPHSRQPTSVAAHSLAT